MSEANQNLKADTPAALQRKPRKRRVWLWIAGIGAALVVAWSVGLCVLVGLSVGTRGSSVSWGSDAVGVIYIEGLIGVRAASTMGAVNSKTIGNYIRQAESNQRVKAIVVYINSPGGAVVPSDEMYRALREATKPVVVSMGDVAASGGYYIACGADKILAHPATITGSIGVYGRLVNAAELFEKLGIEGIIVRSGDSKAAGNIFERPTEEQLAIEQALVDELHTLFIATVAEGRGMDEDEVRALADGRPYTGQQAVKVGLVDDLGGLSDAIQEAARMGGITGAPQIIEYRPTPSLLDLWMGVQRSRAAMPGGDGALLDWLDAELALPQMRYVGP